MDPLVEKYPYLNPYNYCANNPLIYKDEGGKEIWIAFFGRGQYTQKQTDPNNPSKTIDMVYEDLFMQLELVEYKNGNLLDQNGNKIKLRKINNKDARRFIRKTRKRLRKLDKFKNKDEVVKKVMNKLEDEDGKHLIRNKRDLTKSDENHDRILGYVSTTDFDPNNNRDNRNNKKSNISILGHELKHGYNKQTKTSKKNNSIQYNGIKLEEIDAVNFENRIHLLNKDKYKTTKYGGNQIPENKLVGPAPKKIDKNEK